MALRLVPDVEAARGWRDDFRKHLEKQYRSLGAPAPQCVHEIDGGPQLPELLMFFAAEQWNPAALPAAFVAALSGYALAASRVLPVLDDATHAGTHLPEDLQRFHAFLRRIHGEQWALALVDLVLTLIWQHRRERKIFISYVRAESAVIADQLARHYERRGYEVFHDEGSILPGDKVEERIQRGLDDSDIVLVLVSPGVASSEWVHKEIQFAVSRRVGLLGIIWPANGEIDPMTLVTVPSDLCFRLGPTAQTNGAARMLTDAELAEVDRLVHVHRSEAMVGRLRDLIDSAMNALSDSDFDVTEWRNDGHLEMSHKRSRERWVGCVLSYRPDPEELMRCWLKVSGEAERPAGIVVVYPELDARDREEMELRDVCDRWSRSVTPPLLLKSVHV